MRDAGFAPKGCFRNGLSPRRCCICAATALKWAVDEMERRYQMFADAGTKNIATYNGWVERVARGEAKNPNQRVVQSKDFNG